MVKVEKRNGDIVPFDTEKIKIAIIKAMKETDNVDEKVAGEISDSVSELFKDDSNITIENIQDYVELELMKIRPDVAKKYILYREERAKLREHGWGMSSLQKDIYEKKYRYNRESFDGFLNRISDGNKDIKKAILDKKIMPAGRILTGRGLYKDGKKITLSNCYVLPKVEDNLESIFDTAKHLARTYSYGGGVGVAMSQLRPKGAKVNNAASSTTGSVSFMELYSMVTGLIGMRGRRGALMLNMDINHPDIEEFIDSKNDLNAITYANISVNITDEFMEAVRDDKDYELFFKVESSGEVIRKKVNAKKLFRRLSKNNWNMAEPGILYIDRIDDWHLMSEDGLFEYVGVNPCFTGDMKLLTDEGYKTFKELSGKDVNVINEDGFITDGKVWSNGVKETIKLTLSNKESITCTPDHVFKDIDGNEREAKDLKGLKIMPYLANHKKFDEEYIKYGFIQGDGGLGRLTSKHHKGIDVNIGKYDGDILTLFNDDVFTRGERHIYLSGYKDKLIELGFDSKTLPKRKFPSSYDKWNILQKASFLQGCYSANGSVIEGYRISYKTTSKKFMEKLTETLESEFGITANVSVNLPTKVKFDNGEYLCKKSYNIDINKYKDIQIFHNEINFYHEYKKEGLRNLLKTKAPYVSNIKPNGEEEVFDFKEPLTHWGVVNGFIAHNCAEEPLPAFGSCNLTSINLSEFVKNPFTSHARFDFAKFARMVRDGVIYLNEILDENMELHPLLEQREVSRDLRQIGLGIMGLADMFIKLGIKYGSQESISIIHQIGHMMINEALVQSALLAKDHGPFPKYSDVVLQSPFLLENADEETLELVKEYGLRNSQLLTIAPTGSISTLLGCSNGVEPIFQTSYLRKTMSLHNEDVYYKVFTPIVKQYMDMNNLTDENDLPDTIVSTSDLDYNDRIAVQSAWQKYIDASISSTLNLPQSATVEEIEDIYMKAWEQGLKGITIYRDGCARGGILIKENTAKENRLDKIDELRSEIDSLITEQLLEDPNTCPMCGGSMIRSGGCGECQDCGYSPCSI